MFHVKRCADGRGDFLPSRRAHPQATCPGNSGAADTGRWIARSDVVSAARCGAVWRRAVPCRAIEPPNQRGALFGLTCGP